MLKATEYLKEISSYIEKMQEGEKSRFQSFITRRKNGRNLRNALNAIAKTDASEYGANFGSLRRTKLNRLLRNFNEFKIAILEFEGSLGFRPHLKGHDSFDSVCMELRKEIIAAQALAEKDAYHLSIAAIKEIYAKAKKFEVLQVQKDCAGHLTTYFNLCGFPDQALVWKKENMLLSVLITKSYVLQEEMLNRIDCLPCCDQHQPAEDHSSLSDSKFNNRKINWMLEILDFARRKNSMDARNSLTKCLTLFREVREEPFLYPIHFRASVTKLMVEDLFRLGRFELLSAFSEQIDLLNYIPAYRRMPLINFFLHFHLKSGNLESFSSLVKRSRNTAALQVFHPFIQKLDYTELLCHFINGSYHQVLRSINRKEMPESKCVFVDFDMRTMEVLSLFRVGEDNTAFDKLESLRRFLFRHDELKRSEYCLGIYKCLRSQIMKKSRIHLPEINPTGSVYDMRTLIARSILPDAGLKPYPLSEGDVSMAAEDPPQFGRTNNS